MNFLAIQEAVLADAFDESKRSDVKTWVNFRYGWIWDLDDWTFVQGADLVSVTAGSQSVSGVATDFALALALNDATGTPLEQIGEYRDFAARYIGTDNVARGKPEAFVVHGGSIYVGPTSDETSSAYELVYEKAPTALVDDTDEPAIPEQYHLALVHGAKAEGFKLSNVPLASSFDDDFQAAITAMRRKYLRAQRGTSQQQPAWRPC